jgi:epoxyqueuosine reductase QueG
VRSLTDQSLEIELEEMARNKGADLFGIADLTVAQDFICDQGGEYLKRFSKGISIGIHLLDAIIDELYRHEDRSVAFTYKGLYNSVNSRLDHITLLLSKRIQNRGYQACPIPASQIIDEKRLVGATSHKLVANLAGLGWIGRSCLLVTPKYGPRVRFATILTDAPLKAGSPKGNVCKDCSACVDICPAKAFTGVTFNPSEPREIRFNAVLCNNYVKKMQRNLGESLCGLCVYICPHGRPSKTIEVT